MKTRARIGVLAAVIALFSLPLLAQAVNWHDSGANVYANGFVGIGTSSPESALHLFPNQGKGINFKLYNYTYFGTIWSSWHTVLGGNVKASETDNVRMEIANTHNSYGGVAIQMAPNLGFVFHTAPGPSTAGATFDSPRMIIDLAGNVGIGTQSPEKKLHVVGESKFVGNTTFTNTMSGVDATFSGTVQGGIIKANYQDLAEWVPASGNLTPGTVVVLDPSHSNQVMPSHTAYDTSVAGVVSAQPGITLGIPGADKEIIATTGRVRVKVDATGSPIAIGDLLVTGDKPGVAMKSEPINVSGVRMHRPGTIVGKALEPWSGGPGEILVLLSLQ